ncbi:Uncharacterized conserved protein, DUF2252 family [Bryocella elongata]|uniref:Uncharacterized conserved protein, DUF2252 family n=1 Tax=Bryocella elongata TaxID=863522 RepID=A0A1H5U9I7_9BACT|nr:DUF2252 domain-containing protein [Bryocella elongata]SEF71001.1 Uncharacterized conserved protein, DUF2252 family [Bryocella elongata]
MNSKIPTPAQRFAAGVQARKQLARSEHAKLDRAVCPKPPLPLLFEAEEGRLPELLKLKHERMCESPFGFFRGAVPIIAADLSCHPHTGIFTQLCGDAHVLNLGAFASAEGELVFDINDFDESMRGPFEWDLKRLATSLILAGRAAEIARPDRNAAVRAFVESYRRMMREFAAMPVLDMARFQIHRIGRIQPMKGIFAAAKAATAERTLDKLTEAVPGGKGERRFRDSPPLLRRVTGKEAKDVLASLEEYAQCLLPERRHFLEQYRPVDVAFKVVGTGSIGLRDYCVYCEAAHLAKNGDRKLSGDFSAPGFDPLFLQIKEEPRSAYAGYLPADPHAPLNQGHRVANGQRAMQFTSDPFLGYTTIDGRDYLVRQLNDHKAGLDLTKLNASGLTAYADLCGEIFARGHARSGDPIMIAAYLGDSDKFDRAIYEFAHAYANKTEEDWAAMKRAIAGSGAGDGTERGGKIVVEAAAKRAASKKTKTSTKRKGNTKR